MAQIDDREYLLKFVRGTRNEVALGLFLRKRAALEAARDSK
jgi:hypothetical protein